jgi:hypothetical protein
MPSGVQAIFCPAAVVDNASLDLQRVPALVRHVGMTLNGADSGRKAQIEPAGRTGQLPTLQNVDQQRRHLDDAVTGFTLRRAHQVVFICAALHVDGRLIEIDVRPHKTPELARSKPSKRRRRQYGMPPRTLGHREDIPHLVSGRDIAADLQLRAITRLGFRRPDGERDVLRDSPASLQYSPSPGVMPRPSERRPEFWNATLLKP